MMNEIIIKKKVILLSTWPGSKPEEQEQTTNAWPAATDEVVQSVFNLSWMAWSWQTALFFCFIVISLIIMTYLEIKFPGGNPRKGVIGLNTTRGDRLFISLLGSAFIHFLWLFFFSTFLWVATLICAFYFFVVFKYF